MIQTKIDSFMNDLKIEKTQRDKNCKNKLQLPNCFLCGKKLSDNKQDSKKKSDELCMNCYSMENEIVYI